MIYVLAKFKIQFKSQFQLPIQAHLSSSCENQFPCPVPFLQTSRSKERSTLTKPNKRTPQPNSTPPSTSQPSSRSTSPQHSSSFPIPHHQLSRHPNPHPSTTPLPSPYPSDPAHPVVLWRARIARRWNSGCQLRREEEWCCGLYGGLLILVLVVVWGGHRAVLSTTFLSIAQKITRQWTIVKLDSDPKNVPSETWHEGVYEEKYCK